MLIILDFSNFWIMIRRALLMYYILIIWISLLQVDILFIVELWKKWHWMTCKEIILMRKSVKNKFYIFWQILVLWGRTITTHETGPLGPN